MRIIVKAGVIILVSGVSLLGCFSGCSKKQEKEVIEWVHQGLDEIVDEQPFDESEVFSEKNILVADYPPDHPEWWCNA